MKLINNIKDKIKTLTARYTPGYIYDLINKKIPLDKHVAFIKKYFDIIKKYANIAYDYKLYATYLPFIGWLIPFHYFKDDDFAMHHGKQAYMTSVAFAAALILIYFSTYFVPVKLKFIKFFLIIMIYILELLYLAIVIVGTRWIIKQEKRSIPYIDKYDHLINI
jgi:hypothetical protein